MNIEGKLDWAEAHDITSVRLFTILDRYGFFESNLSVHAGYDFLFDVRAGNVRNAGRKILREFQTAFALMLCEQCPREARVKTREQYEREGIGAEIELYQRHDTLLVLWERGLLTPTEQEELDALCGCLFSSLPPWEQ